MAFAAEPVASGQDYTISYIDGRPPVSLEDFTGDIQLTLVRAGQELQIAGAATRTAEAVRFYQKDLALLDRDIRVWSITEQGKSGFFAAPCAAF